MKKVILLAAVACIVSMSACNSTEESTTDRVAKPTADGLTSPSSSASSSASPDVQAAISEVPQFSDPETQKFVEEYAAYMKQAMDVYKSKDMTKIAGLQTAAGDWAKKSQDFSMRIAQNPDDMKKYSDYMMKLSTEMQEAMK